MNGKISRYRRHHSKPIADMPADRRERPCLMCRKPFLSEWIGERICRACKGSSRWREGDRLVHRGEL
jgi:hypothetical protein